MLRLIVRARTKRYIKEFLTPTNKRIELDKKLLKRISVRYFLDIEVVYAFVRGMLYKDFLKTPYWQTISLEVRRRARGKCYLCRHRSQRLQVHHRHYRFHGMEHLCYNDRHFLIAICPECHRHEGARREREA